MTLRTMTAFAAAAAVAAVVVSAGARAAPPAPRVWPVQGADVGPGDTGALVAGGEEPAFDHFGYLCVQVGAQARGEIERRCAVRALGIVETAEGWASSSPVVVGGVLVERTLRAAWPVDPVRTRDGAQPRDQAPGDDHLRYLDRFTNVTGEARQLVVTWGGSVAPHVGGSVVKHTSSGDARIEASDTYVVVAGTHVEQYAEASALQPMPAVAHVVSGDAHRGPARIADMRGDPFAAGYPGGDPNALGYVFELQLAPGESAALMYFVVRAASSGNAARGDGEAVRRAAESAAELVASPDIRGVSTADCARIVNWPLACATAAGGAPRAAQAPPLVESSLVGLRDAIVSGRTTAARTLTAYLARIAAYDRAGPRLNAFVSLNPDALARAAALDADADRAGALHGLTVAIKDNIDVAGLPTSGGLPALRDARAARDADVVAALKAAGAIVIGKTNLDDLALDGRGLSSITGQTLNPYDSSTSPAGSSAGSAVAVAANLASFAIGSDTCYSLSQPAAFTALVTLRPTQGLVSPEGLIPLYPDMDVAGPITRSVADLALVMDVLAPATGTEYRAQLAMPRLDHVRIGVLRERFVGYTGETEVAQAMDHALADLQRLGAVLVDVQVPQLVPKLAATRAWAVVPAQYRAVISAHLRRVPGTGPRSFHDLLGLADGGAITPGVAGYLRMIAVAPDVSEAELAAYRRARMALRDELVEIMDTERLDALAYPSAQSRPLPLASPRTTPGTCEESAGTGLPQLSVPAGWLDARHPVGLSLLGRPLSEARLIRIAHTFELATQHRRPPPAAP